jgi:hypothetical protein
MGHRKHWFCKPFEDPKSHKPIDRNCHKWRKLHKKYGTPPALNNQRRVIYLGYWLSNDKIPALVAKWKEANITHLILTFITQIDVTKPLSEAYSMTLAYKDLTPANRQLLKDNFILGVSYGGAGAMPAPYSLTFGPGAYYQNQPALLASDLVTLAGDINAYYDLDIEHIDDQFDACADFLGQVSQALKQLRPMCQVSHAPQSPYFTPYFGNVYMKIYNDYQQYIDFFNIQYYNNGVCNTYSQLFINAVSGEVAVQQLMNRGMNGSKIVVGKPVNQNEGNAGGYIPLVPDLENIMATAFQNNNLTSWSQNGGVMIWYYNTQNNPSLDNDNILSYMSYVSYLHN